VSEAELRRVPMRVGRLTLDGLNCWPWTIRPLSGCTPCTRARTDAPNASRSRSSAVTRSCGVDKMGMYALPVAARLSPALSRPSRWQVWLVSSIVVFRMRGTPLRITSGREGGSWTTAAPRASAGDPFRRRPDTRQRAALETARTPISHQRPPQFQVGLVPALQEGHEDVVGQGR
jgi:hypothetical protein